MAARADAVLGSDDLELLAYGLSAVCFRCRPAGVPEADLDELNRAVLTAVHFRGQAFLAGTTVDGGFALRACVVNPGMTSEGVDAIVADVRRRMTSTGW